MNLAKDFRRISIILRKRISLFRYNFKMKKELGMYDLAREQHIILQNYRSINLFDFSQGKVGDFHLIDEFSDASEFGGESECEFMLVKD